MSVKNKKKLEFEYVYLEIPIMPPIPKKLEEKEPSNVIVIDFCSDDNNDITTIDYNVL